MHIRPPKIHWHMYFTRKVLILSTLVMLTYLLEEWTHAYLIGRTHELAMGTLFEHLLFGIPFHEEV